MFNLFLLGSRTVANHDEREPSYKSVHLIHPTLLERKQINTTLQNSIQSKAFLSLFETKVDSKDMT